MLRSQITRFQEGYPLIYFACHRRHVRRDGKDRSVTEHQVSILNHLDVAKGKHLSTLAEHLGVTRSTMSISIARLVRQGYVAQVRDEKDGRRVRLTLTTAGAKLTEDHSVLDPDLIKAMFRLVPEGELEAVLQGMERLVACAQRLTNQRKVKSRR